MNPEAQKAYLVSTRALEAGRPLFKVMLALAGILMVRFLVALGTLPAFRPSTVLLAAASASFLLVKTCKTRDLLHPVRVFGALWCFCLALASMHLLPLISDWNYLMWSCVLTALVSFIGGFWLARQFWDRRRASLGATPGEELPASSFLPHRKTLITAALCLAVGTAVLAYEYSLIGEIPILSENMDAARMELFGAAGTGNPAFDTLSIKLIHPFVEFTKYGVFLALIVLFQKKAKSRKVVLLTILLIMLGTLTYASQGGRGMIVEIAVAGVVFFHYLHRRIRLIECGTAVLALFLFIGLLGSLRVKASESAPLFQRALSMTALPEGEFWDGVAFGYMTLTESFEVFYRLTDDLQTMQRPSAGFLFYGLHRFLPRSNLQEVAFNLYSGETITPTFLGEFYADYGYWGVLLGPLVLGGFYGWAYSRGGNRNAIYWIYVRALLTKMLIFFAYVSLFSQYLSWILDLLFMYLLIRRLSAEKAQLFASLASTTGQPCLLEVE